MPSQNSVLNSYIGTFTHINKATVRCSTITFSSNAVFKSIHYNIGALNSDTSPVVTVLRFYLVSNCHKTTSIDFQRCLVNRKSRNFSDFIKIPYQRSIHINVAVFVNNKNISLRRSVVLVWPKPDVAFYVGIGSSYKASPW